MNGLKILFGDELWVIEREDGVAVDCSCAMFLARCENTVIATPYVNDLDPEGILAYHVAETQDNLGTELLVFPEEDCFATREEAEQVLENET